MSAIRNCTIGEMPVKVVSPWTARNETTIAGAPGGQETLRTTLEEAHGLNSRVFGAIEPGELGELHRILRKLASYAT